MKVRIFKAFGILAVFGVFYLAGAGAAAVQKGMDKTEVLTEEVIAESQDWGLGFSEKGKPPTGMETVEELEKYQTYFLGDTSKKRIYLTFDAGYENGNTEPILEALKKHNAKATFFVVGHYLESAPELVKRMVEEGHTVGNHTYHHYDMSKISDRASFEKAMDMGYKTFFWSLAYVDWNQDAQPSHEEAFEKLLSRIHPGAIVLLHNTSSTNGEILDELLTKWEKEGYSFGTLEEVINQKVKQE